MTTNNSEKFIVFKHINCETDNPMEENWYYGTYRSLEKAWEVVATNTEESEITYGICPYDYADALNIKNMPR